MDNQELIELLKELEDIKAKQKALSEKEAQCREDIFSLMQEQGLEKEESDYGTIRLQRRYDKDYGEAIKMLERQLKEAKKLAEDMGDYEITGYKDTLVYIPPKELF
jgi:chromosome segregation ATPase